MFRKYQATMIVVFMVMLMFAFVVLPSIMKMTGTGGGANPVVVSTRYGNLHESDLALGQISRAVSGPRPPGKSRANSVLT